MVPGIRWRVQRYRHSPMMLDKASSTGGRSVTKLLERWLKQRKRRHDGGVPAETIAQVSTATVFG